MRRSTELVTTSLPDVEEDKPTRVRSKSAPPTVITSTTSTNISTRQPRLSLLRRLSNRFFKSRRKKEAPAASADEQEQSPSGVVTSPSKKKAAPTTPLDDVLAERERIDEVRKLILAEDFNTALAALLSDTDEDLCYFNKVKADSLGDEHFDTFSNKHGKLLDYEDRPPPIEDCRICLWCGTNDGHALRCHNQCIYHPIETVTDQLGVEHPKRMEFCSFHMKFCVNTTKHDVPVRIRIPNEDSLCNECYILQNNKPPKCLMRVPGTRRKRS